MSWARLVMVGCASWMAGGCPETESTPDASTADDAVVDAGLDGAADVSASVPDGVRLSAGDRFTCVLDGDGEARCWGSPLEVRFVPPGPFVDLAAGRRHACARRADGTVACWGEGADNAYWLSQEALADVPDSSFSFITGGPDVACGITSGTVDCWPGSIIDPPSELGATMQSVDISVAGGNRNGEPLQAGACALDVDGGIHCWTNRLDLSNAPPPVVASEVWTGAPHGRYVQLSVGDLASNLSACAVNTEGAIRCWGLHGDPGQPWDGGPYVAVSLGGAVQCALAVDGRADCKGAAVTTTPSRFLQLAAGDEHACGLLASGEVECWGANNAGQLQQGCGDGRLDANEACDDGGFFGGDGCDGTCTVEYGWACSGEPSTCEFLCGNGRLDPDEECDDGDRLNGDGCSSGCYEEPEWDCTGEPSDCEYVYIEPDPDPDPSTECGDGVLETELGEVCDDGIWTEDQALSPYSGCGQCTVQRCGFQLDDGAVITCAGAGIIMDTALDPSATFGWVGVGMHADFGATFLAAGSVDSVPLYVGRETGSDTEPHVITELGTLGPPYDTSRFTISADAEGHQYVAGRVEANDAVLCPACADGNLYVAKVLASGTVAWNARHDVQLTSKPVADVTASGELLILGPDSAPNGVLLTRLDTNGAVLWSKPQGAGWPTGLTPTGEGAWLLWADEAGPSPDDWQLGIKPLAWAPGQAVLVDATGEAIDSRTLSGTPSAATLDDDGNLLVAGFSYGADGSSAFRGGYLEKFDAATGSSMWVNHVAWTPGVGVSFVDIAASGVMAFATAHRREAGNDAERNMLMFVQAEFGDAGSMPVLWTTPGTVESANGDGWFTVGSGWGTFYAHYVAEWL